MPIYENLQDALIRAVDIIVIGGGTSGCIIAGRLAAAHPSLSILVIEGGENNRHNPLIRNPAACSTHLRGESKIMSNYGSLSSSTVAHRELCVKTARVLGGGSSVNFCNYTRPPAADFNRLNMNGWSFQDVLPFMQKFETFHSHGSQLVHGYEGPVNISDGGFRVPRVEQMVLESARRGGYQEIEDAQDPTATRSIGAAKWQRFVSPKGVRQDTAHSYLHPLLSDGRYPNLHVVLRTTVSRVLFDDNKHATEVECHNNQGDLRIHVKKLVVIAAGAFGSPQILERSGLGGAFLLGTLGIPVVSDLPQVGQSYQNHPLISAAYKTTLLPGETLDNVLWSEHSLKHAINTEDPILGWNGVDVCFKLRPRDAEVVSFSPAFQGMWKKEYREFLEKPMIYLAVVSGFTGNRNLLPPGQYITMTSWVAYPHSRGSIHITSPNIEDVPRFNSGFLSDTDSLDVEMLVWAYRKGHEIMRSFPFYNGEADVDGRAGMGHPADVFMEDGSLRAENESIEDFVRQRVCSALHSLGTCAMGYNSQAGVVDDRLAVYGVTGLRCADMSICPNNMGSNTASVAMTIGEKAAFMFLEDLNREVN